MGKQFKLVYEKDGIVKGNYEGMPAGKDTPLIERAVLEGKKPVTPVPGPTPEPTGTIEITKNGNYDVKAFATANVNTPVIDPVAIVKDVVRAVRTADFNRNHTEEWPYSDALISLIPGEANSFLAGCMETDLRVSFRVTITEDTSRECLIILTEPTSETSWEIELVYLDDFNGQRYTGEVRTVTDAETGDMYWELDDIVPKE